MTRLATFVHISDLHLGDLDPHTLDATYNDNWQYWRQFDGFLGHDYKSLWRLEETFEELRQKEDAQLIVTGDITASGKSDHFHMARALLGGIYSAPAAAGRRKELGLRVRNWKDYSIPGNHDHWPGIDHSWRPRITGDSNAELAATFHDLPRIQDFPLKNGYLIRFLMINTDGNVGPKSLERRLAKGKFGSQLSKLAAQLSVPAEKEIRVLCLHHSLSFRGDEGLGQYAFANEVGDLSRRALEDFIVEHDLAVLMCGHVHDPPLIETFSSTYLRRTVDYLEARCGTTSQRSSLPLHWKTWTGKRPTIKRTYPNCFLIHRLEEENGGLYWKSEVMWEMRARFLRHIPFEADLLRTGSFQVWPRS